MSWLTALIVYTIVTLAALVISTAAYALWLRFRIHKLAKDIPTAQLNTATLPSENTPIMRYSEYKHRYGSRIREIAIVANSKQAFVRTVANEFVENMRENGALQYHFTYYWGRNDIKITQQHAAEVVKGTYHAIFAIGRTSVRSIQHAMTTQNRCISTVFTCVRDTWWQEENQKRPSNYITGVTGSSGWAKRIKIFMILKPTMKNVLLPVPSGQVVLQSDIQEITTLLNSHGVTLHAVNAHDGHDILTAINQYAHKIDTVLGLRNGITSTFSRQISEECNKHGLTFFSPHEEDIYNGAAAAVSCINMKLGWHSAQKMLAILEEHKELSSVPVTNISSEHEYAVYFNQTAMRLQGLDPSLLVGFAMNHGKKINVIYESD